VASIGSAQGLPTDWIVQALEDDGGRLWMTSGKGLLSVPRRELVDLADGRRARIEPNVYDGADGVLMRTEPFGHPAGWKGPDGRLWFATFGGIAVVDPASLRAPPPRVAIDEVRVNGQPATGSVLGAGPRDVEVTFAARSFAAPETVFLRYRLEGKDTGWIEAGPGRRARFPQLGPGRYRLVVQARHRDGAWSANGASVELVVRQPFYRSPWFALAVALAVGLLLLAAHRMRLARTRAGLQAVMAERARIARDIHDTLAEAFVATSVRLECLDHALESEDRATMRRHLEAARSVVRLSLEEARRAVWVLRPQVLEHGLSAAIETLVGGATGDTRVELEVLGTPRPLAPTVEANLLRIAQEGVSNAYRHARAQRIALRLAFHARAVEMSVSDDGTGLCGPAGGRPVERGLAGMKERAADIGGTLLIESRPGGGTAIHVEVRA
jgi:signal transduction histidine kinase